MEQERWVIIRQLRSGTVVNPAALEQLTEENVTKFRMKLISLKATLQKLPDKGQAKQQQALRLYSGGHSIRGLEVDGKDLVDIALSPQCLDVMAWKYAYTELAGRCIAAAHDTPKGKEMGFTRDHGIVWNAVCHLMEEYTGDDEDDDLDTTQRMSQ